MRPHLSAGIRATEQPRCHTLIQNSFNSVRGNKLEQSSNALLTQINQFFQIPPPAYPPPRGHAHGCKAKEVGRLMVRSRSLSSKWRPSFLPGGARQSRLERPFQQPRAERLSGTSTQPKRP